MINRAYTLKDGSTVTSKQFSSMVDMYIGGKLKQSQMNELLEVFVLRTKAQRVRCDIWNKGHFWKGGK